MGLDLGALSAGLELKDVFSEGFEKFDKAVEQSTEHFGSMGASVTGVATGILTAIGAATAIVAGLTAAVVELGERGAEVKDIKENFDQLNRSIGNSGDVLATLRSATDGTVSDFALMKSANVALSQGLKLSESQFALTGEAARVLAKRTGGDTAQAFDLLTQAMATGRDRALKLIGVHIDSTAAVTKYALSIGKASSELSDNEKIAARQQAVLAAMKETMDQSGRAGVDFADRLHQISANITNFRDELAMAVAKSPVVKLAMDTIAGGLENAFGKNRTQTVQIMIGWINSFVVFLSKAAGVVIEAARFIVNAWSLVQYALNMVFTVIFAGVAQVLDFYTTVAGKVIDTVQAIIDHMLMLPGPILAGMGISKDALEQVSVAAAKMGGKVKETMTYVTNFVTGAALAYKDQGDAALDSAARQNAAFDKIGGAIKGFTGKLQETSKAHVDLKEKTEGATNAARVLGDQGISPLTKATEAYLDELHKLQPLLDAAFAKGIPIDQIAKQFDSGVNAIVLKAKELGQAIPKDIADAKAAIDSFKISEQMAKDLPVAEEQFRKYQNRLLDLTRDSNDARLAQLEDEKQKELNQVNQKLAELKKAYMDEGGIPPALEQKYKDQIAEILDYYKKLEHGLTFSDTMKRAVEQLPTTILNTLKGGGGIEDVGKAVGGLFGASMFGADSAITKMATKGLTDVFGKTAGSALGAVIPGLGSMLGEGLGKIAGSIFGSLFGESTKHKIQDMLNQFADTEGGLDALKGKAQAAGIDMYYLFNARHVEDMTRAIKDVKDALAETDQANQALDAAMQKYGITIDSLGPRFREQKLAQQGLDLYKDFQLLTGAGVDVATVVDKMGKNLVDFAQTAMRTHTAIPEAMKPMIDELIKEGKLVDANGKAYDNAKDAGITFSQTLDDQFKGLLDSIQKLVDALNGIHPEPINIPVNYQVGPSPMPTAGRNGVPANFLGTAAGFASGTEGFRNFGKGTLTMLHGWESVVTKPQAQDIFQSAASVAQGVSGGGSSLPASRGSSSISDIVAELKGIRMEQKTTLPAILERTYHSSNVKAGALKGRR